jgi:hypothetical protein
VGQESELLGEPLGFMDHVALLGERFDEMLGRVVGGAIDTQSAIQELTTLDRVWSSKHKKHLATLTGFSDGQGAVSSETMDGGAYGQEIAKREGPEVSATTEKIAHSQKCTTHIWSGKANAGRCEVCGHFMPSFLLRCVNCRLKACRQCSTARR